MSVRRMCRAGSPLYPSPGAWTKSPELSAYGAAARTQPHRPALETALVVPQPARGSSGAGARGLADALLNRRRVFGIVVRATQHILRALSGTGEASMGQGALATLIGLISMATSALATT